MGAVVLAGDVVELLAADREGAGVKKEFIHI